jgi:hypothetical protein
MKNLKTRIFALALTSMLAASISTPLTAGTKLHFTLSDQGLTVHETPDTETCIILGAIGTATIGLAAYGYHKYKKSETKQPKQEVKKPEARFFVPASWNHKADLHITVKKGEAFRIFVEKNSEITKNQIVDLRENSPLTPLADKLNNLDYDIHRFRAKEAGETHVIFMRTKPSHHFGNVEQAVMVHIEE